MEELTQDGSQLARTMLMEAAQLAESMARVQAQRAWMAQNRSTAQAAQAQQQIAAERAAARMIFRPLTDDRYWRDTPQLDRVVEAYMTAAAWADHDPEAQAAVLLIKRHAEASWGQDVSEANSLPREVGVEAYSGRVGRPSKNRGVQPLAERVPTDSRTARLDAAPGVARPITRSLQTARGVSGGIWTITPGGSRSRAATRPSLAVQTEPSTRNRDVTRFLR